MKKICIVSGSRADWGLLEWPIKVLKEDGTFDVTVSQAHEKVEMNRSQYDLVMLLGDRKEIMQVALCCHLARLPIAHIAGGDVTEGSYDDAMRDCISRMASIHLETSSSAMAIRRQQ